uniref:Uncharacterized protein n=1 Tax=Panagrolaimus sp. ES5 TaxID=591445 RepID=A0AC34G0B6_9BILA
MEADKTVTYPISVSMASLVPFTELAEMPRCRYEVLDPIPQCPDLKNQKKLLKRRSTEEKMNATATITLLDVDVRAGMNVFDPDMDLGALTNDKILEQFNSHPSKSPLFNNCIPFESLILPGATA